MEKVLLISEDYVKSNSGLSDNLWGKFLLPAIREAQEIDLQGILGTRLYESIIGKVADGTIAEEANMAYKECLDKRILTYLLYRVLSNVIPVIGTKMANLGAVTTNDEKATNISPEERDRLTDYYTYRADFYAKRLQEWMKEHKTELPELNTSKCHEIKPNTYSMTECPIWLGGARARRR